MRLKNGLRKLLRISCKNGFFNLQSGEKSTKTIQFGPLGSMLRRNIWREWLSSIINNVDVSMFPIEIIKAENQLKHCTSFLPDVFENYLKLGPFIGGDNPCGFAAYGEYSDIDQTVMNSEVSKYSLVLRKLESRHGLSVVFFCPSKKSSDWFNYWARYRYRWWRKFSSIPSQFSMSDVIETEKSQQLSLMMEFPWGPENLETISMFKENFFQKGCHELSLKPAENLDVAVIVCQAELNLAAFAYLSNSFAEKWRDGQIRRILQFHTKLAPYKVCISIRSDVGDDLKVLTDVARHLEKELKKCRVSIYPYFTRSVNEKTSIFCRYDEMGVPYNIILDSKALHLGIALLRNRDTTLEEQVHITELTGKLLKYLQMKSLDVDEF